MNELVIYTDESEKKGKYYSNFYGGVLVRSKDLQAVIQELEACKSEQNLLGEIKWVKVSANYLEKYVAVMGCFFDLIARDKAKIRIMFTQNCNVPVGLTREQLQNEYHLLYYQFFKHAFGLSYCNCEFERPIRVRVNLDQMPTTKEETARFKSFLEGLNQYPQFRNIGLFFDREQIAEIDSKNHVLLQCLDIVLGSIAFRLNDKHREKPEGQRCRGKKTIAKEKLYRFIYERICQIYPHFNIGETTGRHQEAHWSNPYRHWKFVPKNHTVDKSKTKP